MPLRPIQSNSACRIAVALGAVATAGFLSLASGTPVRAQGTDNNPKEVPTAPDSSAPGTTLSEKLDKSKGVLHPPGGIDPEIQTPAPDPNPNTTPVIPPPGTPGGDPNVQPK